MITFALMGAKAVEDDASQIRHRSYVAATFWTLRERRRDRIFSRKLRRLMAP